MSCDGQWWAVMGRGGNGKRCALCVVRCAYCVVRCASGGGAPLPPAPKKHDARTMPPRVEPNKVASIRRDAQVPPLKSGTQSPVSCPFWRCSEVSSGASVESRVKGQVRSDGPARIRTQRAGCRHEQMNQRCSFVHLLGRMHGLHGFAWCALPTHLA